MLDFQFHSTNAGDATRLKPRLSSPLNPCCRRHPIGTQTSQDFPLHLQAPQPNANGLSLTLHADSHNRISLQPTSLARQRTDTRRRPCGRSTSKNADIRRHTDALTPSVDSLFSLSPTPIRLCDATNVVQSLFTADVFDQHLHHHFIMVIIDQ
jgi:hypothetical protein